MTRRQRLDAYFDLHLVAPSARSMIDCCMFAADWVFKERGIDPAGAFRGAYADLEGAERLVASAGGLLSAVAPGLAKAGCARTVTPVEGDVALLHIGGSGFGGLAAAIRGRGLWVLKAARGLRWIDLPMLAAWKV